MMKRKSKKLKKIKVKQVNKSERKISERRKELPM